MGNNIGSLGEQSLLNVGMYDLGNCMNQKNMVHDGLWFVAGSVHEPEAVTTNWFSS